MCGRYSLITQREDLARALDITEDLLPPDLEPHWNIAPTQPVAVLREHEGLEVARLRWGLIPSWAEDPSAGARAINARRETLATKATFRDPFRERRCAVLADGFYEWKEAEHGTRKVPHYIRLASGEPFTFAGLWDRWRSPGGDVIESCSIVTGQPNDLVAGVHDRMPMILTRAGRERWLDPELRDENELMRVLQPYDASLMEMWPVSRHVNSPANDDPACLEPAETKSDEPPSFGPLFDG